MTSIRELIMDDIQTTLEGVGPVDGQTIASVEPFDTEPSDEYAYPFISYREIDQEKAPSDTNRYEAAMYVGVDVHTKKPSGMSIPTSKFLGRLVDAVETALVADPDRGGNAVDSDLLGASYEYPEQGESWFVARVSLVVMYSHGLTDLTVQQ